jgi:hypothetical protein
VPHDNGKPWHPNCVEVKPETAQQRRNNISEGSPGYNRASHLPISDSATRLFDQTFLAPTEQCPLCIIIGLRVLQIIPYLHFLPRQDLLVLFYFIFFVLPFQLSFHRILPFISYPMSR